MVVINPNPRAENSLDVSVVIPTYNRSQALRRCLKAFEEQDFERNHFEIIVVDDGSPTPCAQAVEDFQRTLPLTLLRQDNAGPATARNTGVTQARGKLLVFTDDDCVPRPDWLSQLAKSAESNPGAAIGGRTVNGLRDNAFSAASQRLVDYLYDYYSGPSAGGEQMFTSNNLALPADRFRAMGGFPTEFSRAAAEDRELCDRWRHLGHGMNYEPAAAIEHYHHLNLTSFLRQHFNYGRGAYHFQQLRKARGRRHRLEPLRFYRDLVLYPFGREKTPQAVLTCGLLCLAQVANALGFFWQMRKGRR